MRTGKADTARQFVSTAWSTILLCFNFPASRRKSRNDQAVRLVAGDIALVMPPGP